MMGYLNLLLFIGIFVYTLQATAQTEEKGLEDLFKTKFTDDPLKESDTKESDVSDVIRYRRKVRVCVRYARKCRRVRQCKGKHPYRRCVVKLKCKPRRCVLYKRINLKKFHKGDELSDEYDEENENEGELTENDEDEQKDVSDPSKHKRCKKYRRRCYRKRKCVIKFYRKVCIWKIRCSRKRRCVKFGYGDEVEDEQEISDEEKADERKVVKDVENDEDKEEDANDVSDASHYRRKVRVCVKYIRKCRRVKKCYKGKHHYRRCVWKLKCKPRRCVLYKRIYLKKFHKGDELSDEYDEEDENEGELTENDEDEQKDISDPSKRRRCIKYRRRCYRKRKCVIKFYRKVCIWKIQCSRKRRCTKFGYGDEVEDEQELSDEEKNNETKVVKDVENAEDKEEENENELSDPWRKQRRCRCYRRYRCYRHGYRCRWVKRCNKYCYRYHGDEEETAEN